MNVKERSVDTVALPDVGQRSPVETMNRKQKNADNKKQKVPDFGLDKNRNHISPRGGKGQAMKHLEIEKVIGREIVDSRGNPTVEGGSLSIRRKHRTRRGTERCIDR